MSDYLTEGWPLGSTSTVYMNGNSVYHVRRYGKPGIIATVELRQEQAEAIRQAILPLIREARAAELETAADDFIAKLSGGTGDGRAYNSYRAMDIMLRDRAAAIRAEQ